MGSFKKNLSIFVVAAVLFNSLPIKAIAAVTMPAIPLDAPVSDNSTSKSYKTPKIVGEVQEKRSANVKQFMLDDHSYEAVIYNEPVHYYNKGQWQDVDNSLEESNDSSVVEQKDSQSAMDKVITAIGNIVDNKNVLKNKQNDYNVSFAKNANSNKLVSISKDNYSISWNIQGTQKSTYNVLQPDTASLEKTFTNEADKEVKGDKKFKGASDSQKSEAKQTIVDNEKKKLALKAASTVEYKSILPNIDLDYKTTAGKLKENITLNKYTKGTSVTFNIDSKNLVPKLGSDKKITFYDEKDPSKVVFVTDIPFMYDKAGETSNNIDVKLQKQNNGYTLQLTPDDKWLSDSGRKFPVVIDPVVQTQNTITSIQDTFVCSNDTTTKYNNIYDRVGYLSSVGITRTYLKFNSLPALKSSDMVTSATLNLDVASVANGGAQVNVHKVSSDWTSTNLVWSNKANYNSTVEDYQVINSTGWQTFDITSVTKSWYNGSNNYGLMLKANNESTGNVAFYSSDTTDSTVRPSASIFYVSNAGLEDSWTYHSQDVGRAGTGYINDYNGNLVYIHNDLDMNGNRMPVSISHVYNSNDLSATIGSRPWMGRGWNLNIYQRVDKVTIQGTIYYAYTDEDGTKHYFKDNGTAQMSDELNMGFTLTKESSTSYSIKDKSDNKIYFIVDSNGNGRFDKEVDNNSNTLKAGYSTASNNNLPIITTLTDGAGRITKLSYDNSGATRF